MIKSKIKTIITVVAVMLCLALAGGWIAKSVISSKANKDASPTISAEMQDKLNSFIVSPEENDAALMSICAMPLSANTEDGIAVLADNSYTLKATIKPDNTSNQSVEWSAAWKSVSSSWANGKSVSDYVTVTPTSSGALTATVTCKEAFGEQVIITATTKDGTNLSAQCTCDYVKRVTKTQLIVPKSSMSDDLGFDTSTGSGPYYVKLYPNVPTTGPAKLKTTSVLGVGTIEEELTTTISYGLSTNYYSVMSSKGYTMTSSDYVTVKNATQFDNQTAGCQTLFGNNFFSNVNYANAVISALSTAGNCMEFTVTTAGEYSSCTNTYKAFVNTSAMAVKATSVTIGDSNIKF